MPLTICLGFFFYATAISNELCGENSFLICVLFGSAQLVWGGAKEMSTVDFENIVSKLSCWILRPSQLFLGAIRHRASRSPAKISGCVASAIWPFRTGNGGVRGYAHSSRARAKAAREVRCVRGLAVWEVISETMTCSG